jgi:rod shape-determining protein MreD
MRRAAFCALALATVLVQVVLVDGLPLPGGTGPDIALVLVVTAGVTQGPVTGMLTGFAAGLGLDLAPPGGYLIGASAFIFCLIGYGCGRLSFRLEHSVPGLLAVAAIGVGAGETAQAAAGLIAPGSGVTLAAVRSGLPTAVLYDVLLCAVLLSIAAVMRARPWVRPSAGRAARSAGMVGLAGTEARTGTAPWRTTRAYDPRAYAPRSSAGAGWYARAHAANRAERKAGEARDQRPAWRAIAARGPEREVPLRLGTKAHEDRRDSSRPGGGHGGSSGPRARAHQPGAVSLGRNTFARRLFRRRARICRRVPRWTSANPARRRATNGRAGGLW